MMPVWLATFLYNSSIGFDSSEVPEARWKEIERLKRLHRRIGDEEMRKWLRKHYPYNKRTRRWFGKYANPEWM